MATNILQGNTHCVGTLSANTMVIPDAVIGDDQIASGDYIDADKLEHIVSLDYRQSPGTAVVADTDDLHIVNAVQGGEIVSISAAITGVIATGADRTVTIDLLKSTGGGAFATVLSATIVLNNTNVLRTSEAGTVNSAGLVTGDILRLTVAVAGAAGNQAEGLIVTVVIKEHAV